MKTKRRVESTMRLLVILASIASAVVPSPLVAQPRASGDVALVGVTVIDPASNGPARSRQTIIVRNGRIQSIGPSTSVAIPRGMRRVMAQGKFAIPGLWDSHVHFMNTGVTALPLLVAHGVTSVREMGGYIDSTRAWQARMRNGALVGPRIMTPGPILESPSYLQRVRDRSIRDPRIGQRILPYRMEVGDSLTARKAIDSLVKLKVDFVKVRTMASAPAYYAILREARRAGLKVAAHQAGVVSLRNAADSGQADFEHGILPPTARLNQATRDSLYLSFAKNGVWYTPTLSVSRTLLLSGDSATKAIFSDEAVKRDARRAYASAWLLEWWRMQVDERVLDTASTRAAALDTAYRSSAADVRRMHQAGVPILAGTDAGSVLVYPGFSLHEELRLLVDDAGLSPREALRTATEGPAKFFGLDSMVGRIVKGQVADIVLLDADPLADINNTRRIFAVMQAGRLHSRRDLDAMLENVRRVVAH
ncbi:MAG TPA: amidohydrolase family protein [Gemmatimonadaceae bacterium]|nr:amidohydrolase family protein [Gemmatimonadaceae bacterium]